MYSTSVKLYNTYIHDTQDLPVVIDDTTPLMIGCDCLSLWQLSVDQQYMTSRQS